MLLQTEETHQYVVIVVRAAFNSRAHSVANLCIWALWKREGLQRTRRERIISPVEQHGAQRGTLQIGELLRMR